MDKEQAIRILSAETSMEAVAELKYYAGFNQMQVIEQIQEAMTMGAEALKELDRIVEQLEKASWSMGCEDVYNHRCVDLVEAIAIVKGGVE